jgi:GNAT superfamily N-acetyltransferase
MAESSSVPIRPAQIEDAAALHELHTASVRAICSTCYAPETIDGWLLNRNPEGYFPPILRGEIFIAEQGAQIVGFGEAVPGTVIAIYVHPSAVGRGIGSALLAQALAVASHGHNGPVRLESTLNARSFYERFGFREIEQATVQRNQVHIPVVVMECVRA